MGVVVVVVMVVYCVGGSCGCDGGKRRTDEVGEMRRNMYLDESE